MKNLLLLTLIIFSLSCAVSPKFTVKSYYNSDDIMSLHKRIAILPVNYAYNQAGEDFIGKVFSRKDSVLLSEQIFLGQKLQHIIYKEFSKKLGRMEILNDIETNRILAQKNIKAIRNSSKVELAKILNVDAVIYCDAFMDSKDVTNYSSYNSQIVPNHSKAQFLEFVIEIHGNTEEDIVWKAKAILPVSHFDLTKHDISFRNIVKSDLLPILPYNQ